MKPLAPPPSRRLPLWLRLTALIVVLVMAPLGASAYLIGQVSDVASNFGAAEAKGTIGALEKASDAYHNLFETTKRLHAEIADRLSKRRDLHDPHTPPPLQQILTEESRVEPSLRAIEVLRGETTIAEAHRAVSGAGLRDKTVDQPLDDQGSSPSGSAAEGRRGSIDDVGTTLRLTFEVSATLQDEMQHLKQSLDSARTIAELRSRLPESYRNGFILLVSLAAIGAALGGIIYATRLTRRIQALVVTARKVGRGDLDERVRLRGSDEVAEFGVAFDAMLDQLAKARRDLEHQQRMSVWQDVARQLAHEIKNPLTPIQLAVQEAVSQYKGDDARYAKMLATTKEIVEEEIASLGRLVDTFRTLGQLPKVAAAPIALAEVIEELQLQPQLAARLELQPPPVPVTVRADKLLLKRVLVNLVENGIHAGQEAGSDGKVVVSWSADVAGDAVRITIDDHGKGIAPGDREKIFEPYVTTKATGTGLGLAISRKIVIEHGGELSVAATPPVTGGARFIVSLPLRSAEQSLM